MRFHASAILAALGLLACSGNGGGGVRSDAGSDGGASASLPSPALDPVDACNQLAQALATLEVRCNRLATVDQAAWVAAYCAGWIQTEQALFDAGQLAYDPTAVNCEASFRKGQSCNSPNTTPSGCTALAWGTLLTGDVCGDPYSCMSGDYCNRSAKGIACGTCELDPQLSDPCGPAVSDAPCVGSLCDGVNCQDISQLAGPCGQQSTVCAPTLTCQNDVCSHPAAEGASCGQDGDCLDGLFCDPNLDVCSVRSGVGTACPAGACVFGAVCVVPVVDAGLVDAGPGTCVQMEPAGPCVLGLFCLEGEMCGPDGGCVAQPGLGQACTAAVPCLAGSCFGGTCVALPPNQPCSASTQCQSNLCGGSGAFNVCAGACTSL